MAAAETHHRVRVEAELGSLRLYVRLHFAAPWTVIFGPSGSGKSSLLRAMCGLLETGRVDFAERQNASNREAGPWADDWPADDWLQIDGPNGRTATHWRGLAYAPQGAPIFSHMTVRENVAFSLHDGRGAGGTRQSRSAIVEDALKMFALESLAERTPRDLSGGERQRMNLARAFAVPQPRLMLLDEPFTGIDHATRDILLPLLRDRLAAASVPAISVTHDVEEALLLNAEVIRLDAGRVLAQGPAREVLAAERDRLLRALG